MKQYLEDSLLLAQEWLDSKESSDFYGEFLEIVSYSLAENTQQEDEMTNE